MPGSARETRSYHSWRILDMTSERGVVWGKRKDASGDEEEAGDETASWIDSRVS